MLTDMNPVLIFVLPENFRESIQSLLCPSVRPSSYLLNLSSQIYEVRKDPG
jgi:hypothetical protein